MFDNKIIISFCGIVLLAPAAPFLVMCLIGIIVVIGGIYALYKFMEED